MLSLVSHTLSLVTYVVLKKIFFFLSHLELDFDSNLFGHGLDSDSIVLVLDSTKVNLNTALPHHTDETLHS